MSRFQNMFRSRYIPYSMRLLAAMMVVTIVVAAVIGVALCRIAIHLIDDMDSTLVQKNMQIVGQNLSKTMEVVDEYAMNLTTSNYIRDVSLVDQKENVQELLDAFERNWERQIQQSDMGYGIHASFINVYLKNGITGITFENLPYNDYFSCVKYYEENGSITSNKYTPMTWVESVQLQDISGKKINCMVWVRFIYDSVTMEKIGVAVGGVNESVFKDVFGIFPQAYLCQTNGNVLSFEDDEQNDQIISTELINQICNSRSTIDTLNWNNADRRICYWKDTYFSLILIVPETTLQTEMQNLTHWYVICSIIVIGIGVLLGTLVNYLLTKSLSKSILKLKNTVQKVDQGELKARFHKTNHNDEITFLGEHFNHMLDSLERIYAEKEQEALGRKDLEIQLLQSQINPHLLYNTLNSVALAVRNDQQQVAQDLLYTLSDFIRLSLSNGHSIVTLATELELLMKYIVVQNLASHRNILLDIQVPDELLSAKVIRTSLQPIVENAVLHGFAGYRDDGCIQVKAELSSDGRNMDIYIRDNGLGIPPQKLSELNDSINRKDYKEMCSHFGLYNVNWRIKYTWGNESYGMTINSEESDYTEVKMHLPYVTSEGK